MSASKLYISCCMLIMGAVTSSCDQQQAKQKPALEDTTKTTLQAAVKKDIVVNNPQKNYGTATVGDPCIKSLLQVIKESKSFKENTASLSSQDINYTVNWVKAADPALNPDTSAKTNAVRVDVKKIEDGEDKKLCSYVYNNVNGTMYLINNQNKLVHALSSITPQLLKKIRNSCYWGVASGK